MNNISNSLRTAVKKENTAFNNEGRVGKQTDKLPQTTARLQSGRGISALEASSAMLTENKKSTKPPRPKHAWLESKWFKGIVETVTFGLGVAGILQLGTSMPLFGAFMSGAVAVAGAYGYITVGRMHLYENA